MCGPLSGGGVRPPESSVSLQSSVQWSCPAPGEPRQYAAHYLVVVSDHWRAQAVCDPLSGGGVQPPDSPGSAAQCPVVVSCHWRAQAVHGTVSGGGFRPPESPGSVRPIFWWWCPATGEPMQCAAHCPVVVSGHRRAQAVCSPLSGSGVWPPESPGSVQLIVQWWCPATGEPRQCAAHCPVVVSGQRRAKAVCGPLSSGSVRPPESPGRVRPIVRWWCPATGEPRQCAAHCPVVVSDHWRAQAVCGPLSGGGVGRRKL